MSRRNRRGVRIELRNLLGDPSPERTLASSRSEQEYAHYRELDDDDEDFVPMNVQQRRRPRGLHERINDEVRELDSEMDRLRLRGRTYQPMTRESRTNYVPAAPIVRRYRFPVPSTNKDTTLHKFPKAFKQYSKTCCTEQCSEQCGICWEPITIRQLFLELPSSESDIFHVFHYRCILYAYLYGQGMGPEHSLKCPICRESHKFGSRKKRV